MTARINRQAARTAYAEKFKLALGGMTIAELSRRTGLADSALRAYEQGSSAPVFPAAALIARALGRSLDWFAGDADEAAADGNDHSAVQVARLMGPRAAAAAAATIASIREQVQCGNGREFIVVVTERSAPAREVSEWS